MCNSILAHGIGLSFIELEPFGQREALNWLISNAHYSINGKLKISIRHLATIWKWHRSKVERFLKFLKEKTVIETVVDEGRTKISVCNARKLSCKRNCVEESAETVYETVSNLGADKVLGRDAIDISCKPSSRSEMLELWEHSLNKQGDVLSQKRDTFDLKKKKEKNQKKEKEEEDLKEKNIPYRDIKKEKVFDDEINNFISMNANELVRFAASIEVKENEVIWELAKFKDHWQTGGKKLPKNIFAAFRNWLRRSVEFKSYYGNYERNSKTKQLITSFDRFLVAGTRAVAELEGRGLDWEYARQSSAFKQGSSFSRNEFCNLQPAN